MEFDPEPADALEAIYRDGDPRLADRIDHVLDLLEQDHRQAAVRRRRFQSKPFWAIPVHAGAEEYVILWELVDETVVIRYLGPASF